MKQLEMKSFITEYQLDELSKRDQQLVQMAIEATNRSYAPYSHFHVGAALELTDGRRFMGCNQENAAFPAGLCAERAAIFAAGTECPTTPVECIAIAARGTDGHLTEQPVSPCGTCRQVLIETETRFARPVRILLYGTSKVYAVDSIRQLMPLSFSEF
jgi:cytidine deaminase